MAEFMTYKLGELVVNHNAARRPIKSSERIAGATPYYGASGIVDWVEGFTHEGDFLLVSEDGENLRSRSTPVAFNASGRIWVNNHAHVVTGREAFDTRFLGYALAVTDITGYLTGSAQPKLSKAALESIQLTLPPPKDRAAITDVLGALDDKIAANDKAARLADEFVRARYEALAGDPVPLASIAVNVRDQVDPKNLAKETPYIGLEHVPRRSMWLSNFETAAKVTSAKAMFRAGDVLFGKLRPYFHKVVDAPFDGIASTDILVVRSKRPELRGLVLAAASSDAAIAATTASSEGTRMPRTKWIDLGAVELAWPGEERALAFSSEVADLAAWAAATAKESLALAATRDELLPLLMSGAVRVKDAEKTLEGVL